MDKIKDKKRTFVLYAGNELREVGHRLGLAIKNRGWSNLRATKEFGVSKPTLYDWLHGRRSMSLEQLYHVAKKTGQSVLFLIGAESMKVNGKH